jgi:DNA-binding protein
LIVLEDLGQTKVVSTISDYEPSVFDVHNEPVMIEAFNVVSILGKYKKAILRAKGNSIPNAVAIANIITEKMLKGNSKIQKIVVDSEIPAGYGRMLSTIEIVILKN